jgi:serine/threonine protein kinase
VFVAVEYCDGGSVDALIRITGGCLSVDEALGIVVQVLDGLQYLHGRGLVHRNVNPKVIMLSGIRPNWTAKIALSGLVKRFVQEDALPGEDFERDGSCAGTLIFMPRQQIINYKYSKPEVDVWATAACLYNMLTGHFPRDFPRGKDPVQIILSTDAIPIRKRNPSIPVRLAEVIDHALRDKPEIPFKAAAELKRALEGEL